MDISFQPESMYTTNFKFFMAIIDMMYILDIFICFRTTFPNQDGVEVKDTKLIASEYIRGTFFIDLIACLPLEYFSTSTNKDDSTIKLQGILKLGRLFRINRIIRFLNSKKEIKAAA